MKEWLSKTKPEEEPDVLKDEENLPKGTEGEEAIVDLTKSGFVRSAVVSSLPKINLHVFHGDPCEWPSWYGMFKALVHDQRLTKAAANMQLVIKRLPSAIAERWSRRKLELQPQEVDLVDLDKWLEMEVQVKEMAFGCPKTIETPKQDGGKFRPNSGRSRWPVLKCRDVTV